MIPTQRLALYITYTAGFIMLSFGIYNYYATQSFLDKAITAEGVIVGFQSNEGTFRPIAEFVDHKGIKRVHYSKSGSNPPRFFINEKVKVLYNPNDPKYPVNSKIDSTFSVWGISIFLTGIGSIFLLISTLVWYLIKFKGGVLFFRKEDRIEFEKTGKIE